MDALCPLATPRLIERNFEVGRSGQRVLAGIQHIMDGYSSPVGIHDWFNRIELDADGDDNGSSAHFGVFMDGSASQYVRLTDTAWSNGPVHNPNLSLPWLADLISRGKRVNPATWSIEHQGKPGDTLTVAQMTKSVAINRWCVEQTGVVPSAVTLVGHFQIDNINRHFCPGSSFPWARFLADMSVIARSLPSNAAYELGAWRGIYSAAQSIAGLFTAPSETTYEAIYSSAQFLFATDDPDDVQVAHALLVALGGSKQYWGMQASSPDGSLINSQVETRLRHWLRQNKLRHGAEA